nr:hypothetical protein [Tanacetum cinerariifolium]
KSDDDKTSSDSGKGSDSKQDSDGSESDSKSDQQEYDDDVVKDDHEDGDDKFEGDEDRGMDSDDVQDKKTDVKMTDRTPTLPPTIETTNIPPLIPDFALVFRFNDRVITLENDVVKLKKNPLHTQVTSLVNDHLDTRMGETKEEFVNFLSAALTDRITKQVKNQLSWILTKEVSNFASPVIETMITKSLNHVNLAKASSQPQLTYEATATLTEFELKKILIDIMNSS